MFSVRRFERFAVPWRYFEMLFGFAITVAAFHTICDLESGSDLVFVRHFENTASFVLVDCECTIPQQRLPEERADVTCTFVDVCPR